jgi:nitroimidazol reductase NimA-like FMN-containing flavoprotein (pyridoxamine 5'-phosphate oxidase superfamily)
MSFFRLYAGLIFGRTKNYKMLGELNELQIDHLLLSQVVGRIACTNGKLPYIVPVTYVFDGKSIIGQTREGRKLEMLRKNPNVCFEVDSMTNMANWQSALVFGTFIELKGRTAQKAREYMVNHLWPLLTSDTVHPHEHQVSISSVDDSNRIKPVMYKIRIKEKSGRFEKK